MNDAEIVDILGEFNDRELSGKVILELKYEDETKDEQKLQVEVPFLIAYEGDLSRGSVLEENYAHAECADKRHILLETVISVPAQNMPVRALKKFGHFERWWGISGSCMRKRKKRASELCIMRRMIRSAWL